MMQQLLEHVFCLKQTIWNIWEHANGESLLHENVRDCFVSSAVGAEMAQLIMF